MPKKIFGIIFTLLFLNLTIEAQEVSVHGEFQQDSVKIAIPIPYTLTARYPKDLTVIFPDSLFDFSPFEFESKEYYTTKTDSLLSFDSVIYFLSTFEVDSIQRLSLPIYHVDGHDSSSYFPTHDSVILINLITEIPDSIQLKENTAFLPVPTQFNYPYFLIGIAILVIIIIVIFFVFGKRLQNAWKLRRLTKQYKKYIIKHENAVTAVSQEITLKEANYIVQIWKKYLEKLEKQPYTKLTTKELGRLYTDDVDIIDALKEIDRLIYGGKKMAETRFDQLKEFATKRYEDKKQEVRNG